MSSVISQYLSVILREVAAQRCWGPTGEWVYTLCMECVQVDTYPISNNVGQGVDRQVCNSLLNWSLENVTQCPKCESLLI